MALLLLLFSRSGERASACQWKLVIEFLLTFLLNSSGSEWVGSYLAHRVNPSQFLSNNGRKMDNVKYTRSKCFTSVKLKTLDISFLAFLEQK